MTEITQVISIERHHVTLGCITTSCKACSGSSFCNIQGKTFTAINPEKLSIKVGDTVDVYLPPGKTIFSGFMILIFPLILFLAGLLGVRAAVPGAGDGLQALGGFIGLAAGFLIGYIFGLIKKKTYQPVITGIHQDWEE